MAVYDVKAKMATLVDLMNAKVASFSEADLEDYVHPEPTHNGEPFKRAQMAANIAAAFATGNSVRFGCKATSVGDNAGIDENGRRSS